MTAGPNAVYTEWDLSASTPGANTSRAKLYREIAAEPQSTPITAPLVLSSRSLLVLGDRQIDNDDVA